MKKFLFSIIFSLLSLVGYSQNNNNQLKCECANGDFETGTFANWQGELGWCCPISTSPSGIVPGRHTIMSGGGVDPYSCGGLKVVAPGGNFSARLGNANVGAEAEKLKYSFVVDSTKFLFLYKYAVVLEDPGHPSNAQPYMNLNIKVNGQSVGYCGTESFTAGGNLAGKFKNCGPYQWKDWETVGYDLEPYNGQTVTIEFATGDCAYGGHFGYGYIDAFCTPKKLKNTFCANSSSKSTTLEAPEGFNYLWTPGGMTTQKVTINNPQPGVTYTCTMSSKLKPSCKTFMTAKMDTAGIQAYFTNTPCSNKVLFKDSIVTPKGTWITNTKWDFGDGNIITNKKNPEHSFPGPGHYDVSLIVTNNNGCIDTIKIKVDLEPPPKLAIGSGSSILVSEAEPFSNGYPDGKPGSHIYQNKDTNYVICVNTNLQFKDATTLPNNTGKIISWNWNFGDGDSSILQNPTHFYPKVGTYDLRFIAKTTFGCEDTLKRKVIVLPRPKPDFVVPNVCLNDVVNLTNQSSIDTGFIKKWYWDFGDGNSSIDSIPNYQYSSPGTYNVKLVTTSDFGCRDSVVKPVVIYPLPKPDFNTNQVCLNNPTQFTNLSSISSGTIDSLLWTFGDGDSSIDYNPVHLYDSLGGNTPTLYLTSNFGCKDSISKPITINPLPLSNFNIKDVCHTFPSLFGDNSSVSSGVVNSWNWNFGDGYTSTSQNPSHTYSQPGTYNINLIVTTDEGCKDTIKKSTTVNPEPKSNFSVSNPCLLQPSKFTNTSTISSGVISSSQWDFGDGVKTYIKNPDHTYGGLNSYNVKLVTISDKGCSDTLIKPVTIYPIPVPDFNFNKVCLTNGTVFMDNSNIQSGNLLFWNWNFGDSKTSNQKNPTHIYSTDGDFNVQLVVTSDKTCQDTVEKKVTVHPEPKPDFNFNVVCENKVTNFGDLTKVNSGTIVSWKWSFGDGNTSTQKNPSHTYQSSGTYNVKLDVVTDKGCTGSITKQVVVNPLPITDFVSSEECQGDSTEFISFNLNPSQTITNWSWNFGDGTFSLLKSPKTLYKTFGTFLVTLVSTNIFGCTDTVIHESVVNPLPIVQYTNTTECLGFTTKFNNTSSVPLGTITYDWNFGDGIGSTVKDPTHSYTTDGTFNTQLIVTTNEGCKDTLKKDVVVHPKPIANFLFNNECKLIPVQFTDQSTIHTGTITNWNWNFPSTKKDPTFVFTKDTVYDVTLMVNSNFGCKDTLTKQITIYPIPTPNFTSDFVCLNNPTPFFNLSTIKVGTLSHQWSFGDGVGSNLLSPLHTYQSSGTFGVKLITTSNFGCKDSITKPTIVHPLPINNFTFNEVCLGFTTQFKDSSTIQTGSIVGYNWSFGDNNQSNIKDPTNQYNTCGNFQTQLITTSNFGCQDTIIKTIPVNCLPVSNFNGDNVCLNDTTPFIDLSQGNLTNWDWSFGDGNNSIQQSPKHNYLNWGVWNVQLIVTNDKGCKDTSYKDIVVYPLPISNFTTDPVCKGLPTQFKDQSISIGNTTITEWNWNFGDNTTSTQQNPSNTYKNDGDYLVNLEVKTNVGCKDTINKSVEIYPLPQVDFEDTTSGCYPLETTFKDLTTIKKGGLSSWLWSFGDGYYSNQQNPQHTYGTKLDFPIKYDVNLIVTSDKGCSSSLIKRGIVSVYPLPRAEFQMLPNPTSILSPKVQFTDKSIGQVITWNWDFGDGLVNTTQNPQHIYQEPGLYIVRLMVLNQWGCPDTTYKTMEIQPDFTFYIPNSFTPNGDGVNDMFYGYGIGVTTYNMVIFDRWGNNIFGTEDIKKGWDGRANGGQNVAQQDVYVYIVKLTDVFGKEHKYIGKVTLVR